MRSEEKFGLVDSRVVRGTRDSDFMVTRRPRWEGVETRVLKASCSSWEAGEVLIKMLEEEYRVGYLIFLTAF